jgi:PAS domain-containing protein
MHSDDRYWRAIAGSTSDCVKILDMDGRLTFINSAGLRQLDVADRAALLNRPLVEHFEGDVRVAAQEAIERARRGGSGRFQAMFRTVSGAAR